MNRYRINIHWSEEDQVFIAEVPELPGCMTHGDTQAAARANAHKAIQGWIDTANKFGDPVPKPKGARGTFNRLAAPKYLGSRRKLQVRRNNPISFFPNGALHPTINPEAY